MPSDKSMRGGGDISAPASGDARSEARFPCKPTLGRLRAGPDSESLEVEILDVSRSGIRITLPADLPTASRVELDLKSFLVTGEIRYCRVNEKESFDAGLKILDVVEKV